MDPEDYRKKLEVDILKIIEEKLQKGEMDVIRAQTIAKMVLFKLHPPLSLEQIYEIAPTLDDEFIELSMTIAPIIKAQRGEIEKVVTQHALKLIHSGKFGEAIVQIQKTIN